ncbi:MAG: hypothetical protein IT454_10325 [Planctomycetes bacterium]|nr:hypothetical protein [Planctomycetota bacterium]
MSALHRIGRALALALLLPALLAPSGWALRMCFCDAMTFGVGFEDLCCNPEPARGCCESEDEPQERAPAHHQCEECESFDVGNQGLQPTSAPHLPQVAPPIVIDWSAPRSELWCSPTARRDFGRAPPGRVRALPLRI